MMRVARRSTILLLLGLVACFSVGCGSSPYATPEATLETAKKAMIDKDYKAFCGCLTPEVRDELAAGLVFIGGFMQLAAVVPAEDDEAKKAKAAAEKIKKLIEKHGITEESGPKVNISLDASEEDKKRELLKLIEPIKDRDAFIAEFIPIMMEASDDNEAPMTPDAKLTDVKIEGDAATATLVQTRGDGEKKDTISFKKIDAEWKISKFPH